MLKCSVQLHSVTQLCLTLCNPMDCSTPGFPVLHHLLESVQTHVRWDAFQPSHPLSPSSPALNLLQYQCPFQESALHIRWPKHWSFSFSISSSNEYSGFDLLAVQETLKSLLQHHIRMHQFFGTLPSLWSNSHIGIWLLGKKSIALTIGTFVGKVMSLIFNMLSGFVRAFLSRSMCLLISWLQSTSAVIGAQENKICHCFYFFPIYLSWSDVAGWHDLSFLNVEF